MDELIQNKLASIKRKTEVIEFIDSLITSLEQDETKQKYYKDLLILVEEYDKECKELEAILLEHSSEERASSNVIRFTPRKLLRHLQKSTNSL